MFVVTESYRVDLVTHENCVRTCTQTKDSTLMMLYWDYKSDFVMQKPIFYNSWSHGSPCIANY